MTTDGCSEKRKAAKTRRQKGSSDDDDDDDAQAAEGAPAGQDPFFQHNADPFADPFFQVSLRTLLKMQQQDSADRPGFRQTWDQTAFDRGNFRRSGMVPASRASNMCQRWLPPIGDTTDRPPEEPSAGRSQAMLTPRASVGLGKLAGSLPSSP